MRKLLSSLAGLTLIIGTTSGTVVACGSPSTNQATKESNKVNHKTVTLNDTASVKYENKSAVADANAIDQQLEQSGYLASYQAKDFHFDPSNNLKTGPNKVNYSVQTSDGSTADGSLNVIINPAQSSLTPSTPSKAKTESDKVNGKTVNLYDTASVKYENKTANKDASTINQQLVNDDILTKTEANDFTYDDSTKLKAASNTVNYTVKASDGSTANGSLNVVIHPYTPTPPPPTPSKAKTEANKVNGKTIDLNDTSSVKYENKTANDDASAVKTALTQAGDITTAEAADFTFDSTKQLQSGNNNNIGFTVNASDKSTAIGSFNIVINPYKPTPPPPPSPETAQAIANKIINKTI